MAQIGPTIHLSMMASGAHTRKGVCNPCNRLYHLDLMAFESRILSRLYGKPQNGPSS